MNAIQVSIERCNKLATWGYEYARKLTITNASEGEKLAVKVNAMEFMVRAKATCDELHRLLDEGTYTTFQPEDWRQVTHAKDAVKTSIREVCQMRKDASHGMARGIVSLQQVFERLNETVHQNQQMAEAREEELQRCLQRAKAYSYDDGVVELIQAFEKVDSYTFEDTTLQWMKRLLAALDDLLGMMPSGMVLCKGPTDENSDARPHDTTKAVSVPSPAVGLSCHDTDEARRQAFIDDMKLLNGPTAFPYLGSLYDECRRAKIDSDVPAIVLKYIHEGKLDYLKDKNRFKPTREVMQKHGLFHGSDRVWNPRVSFNKK